MRPILLIGPKERSDTSEDYVAPFVERREREEQRKRKSVMKKREGGKMKEERERESE